MKKESALTAGISEPDKVDTFMAKLDHPMGEVIEHLRKLILGIDKRIGEGIFYNAPAFYYTGKMRPFEPKEYKRYIVGCNLYKKDMLRMIFLRGATVKDPSGLLIGEYRDGRRLALFGSVAEVKKQEKALKNIIKQLVKKIDD